MNIFLTFDYELFFGPQTGSAQKCMLEPTERLMDIANSRDVKLVFFVDVGYLIKMEEFSKQFHELKNELFLVRTQISKMLESGHDVQLHIHPHWEKSFYKDGKWTIHADGAYKLDDFSDEEIQRIVRSYKIYLDELIGGKITAFRAGGWCIQPFSRLQVLFEELGIKYDSSVIPGGKFSSSHYSFDFTSAPLISNYRFSSNESFEDENGYFTEYPISSWKYSPIFFWKLYVLGRIFPTQHKMIGDGVFLPQPGKKKAVLTQSTWNHVSADGFYASMLSTCLAAFEEEKRTDMVIIAHPKGMTQFAYAELDKFITKASKKHVFKTFKSLQ